MGIILHIHPGNNWNIGNLITWGRNQNNRNLRSTQPVMPAKVPPGNRRGCGTEKKGGNRPRNAANGKYCETSVGSTAARTAQRLNSRQRSLEQQGRRPILAAR
jgi:hypothetical protein